MSQFEKAVGEYVMLNKHEFEMLKRRNTSLEKLMELQRNSLCDLYHEIWEALEKEREKQAPNEMLMIGMSAQLEVMELAFQRIGIEDD